jgi:hypothetical protein
MRFIGFYHYRYLEFDYEIPEQFEDEVLRMTYYNPNWALPGSGDLASEWPLLWNSACQVGDFFYGEAFKPDITLDGQKFWLQDIDTKKHQTDYRPKP